MQEKKEGEGEGGGDTFTTLLVNSTTVPGWILRVTPASTTTLAIIWTLQLSKSESIKKWGRGREVSWSEEEKMTGDTFQTMSHSKKLFDPVPRVSSSYFCNTC
jgi:hypothetical protein